MRRSRAPRRRVAPRSRARLRPPAQCRRLCRSVPEASLRHRRAERPGVFRRQRRCSAQLLTWTGLGAVLARRRRTTIPGGARPRAFRCRPLLESGIVASATASEATQSRLGRPWRALGGFRCRRNSRLTAPPALPRTLGPLRGPPRTMSPLRYPARSRTTRRRLGLGRCPRPVPGVRISRSSHRRRSRQERARRVRPPSNLAHLAPHRIFRVCRARASPLLRSLGRRSARGR